MTKASIRSEMLSARDIMSPMTRELLSNTVIDNVLTSKEYISAHVIFLYSSIRNEVDTIDLIEQSLKDGKKVALPVSYMSNGSPKMDFYYIKSRSDLVPGYMGILEPDRRKTSVVIANDMPDTIVVPGVAFDYSMNRIGYGAGFYDSYLFSHNYTTYSMKPYLLGICYDFQMGYDITPEPNDIKMNLVVTENGCFYG